MYIRYILCLATRPHAYSYADIPSPRVDCFFRAQVHMLPDIVRTDQAAHGIKHSVPKNVHSHLITI